jgi:hypothetical protein
MDVWSQALVLGDCGEKIAQHVTLFGVERGGHPVLVSAGQLGKPTHQLLSGRGEVQRTKPTIAGVAAPFDIAAILEFVDVGDDATGQQTQLRAQGLLARPGL